MATVAGGGGGTPKKAKKGPPSDYGPASAYYDRGEVSRTVLNSGPPDRRTGTGGSTNRTGKPVGKTAAKKKGK